MDFPEVQRRLAGSKPTVFYAPQIVDYYNKFGKPLTALLTPFSTINDPPSHSYGLPSKHLNPESFLEGTAYEIANLQRQTRRAQESAGGGDTIAEGAGSLDRIRVTPNTLAWLTGKELSRALSLSNQESSLLCGSANQSSQAASLKKPAEAGCVSTNLMPVSSAMRNQFQEAKQTFLREKGKVSVASHGQYWFIDVDDMEKIGLRHSIIQNGSDPETLTNFETLSQTALAKTSFQDQSKVMRIGLKALDDKAMEGRGGRVLDVEPPVYNMLLRDPEVFSMVD